MNTQKVRQDIQNALQFAGQFNLTEKPEEKPAYMKVVNTTLNKARQDLLAMNKWIADQNK